MRKLGARHRLLTDQRGMTLVELMVAMMMFIVLAGAAILVLIITVRDQPAVANRSYDIQQARVLEERFTHELRATYNVTSWSASSITFDTYLRRTTCGSTATPPATAPAIACQVTYSCTAGTCTRLETPPGATTPMLQQQMVSGLSSSNVFGYSPGTGTPTYVTVTLSFPASDGANAITLQDGTDLRNE